MWDCVCLPLVNNEDREYVQWIGSYLHQCAYTPSQVASVFLGFANIALWIPALIPQLLANYKNKAVEALSFLFLLQWLLGDISNLIGSIWSEQLKTQVITAIYFCSADGLLLFQYLYYKHFYNHCKATENEEEDSYKNINDMEMNDKKSLLKANGVSPSFQNSDYHASVYAIGSASQHTNNNQSLKQKVLTLIGLSVFSIILVSLPMILDFSSSTADVSSAHSFTTESTHLNRFLLAVDDSVESRPICDSPPALSIHQQRIGHACAWVSGLLYFFSRIPQVWQNYKRQSCEGLSAYLFLCSVSANLAYGLQICLWTQTAEFWAGTFPFILGSLGVIVLDGIILYQSWVYNRNK